MEVRIPRLQPGKYRPQGGISLRKARISDLQTLLEVNGRRNWGQTVPPPNTRYKSWEPAQQCGGRLTPRRCKRIGQFGEGLRIAVDLVKGEHNGSRCPTRLGT